MRTTFRTLVTCAFVSAFLLGPLAGLRAQPYAFDENGLGFWYMDSTPYLLPSSLGSDPSGGLTNTDVLIYPLGYLVDSGDVEIIRPGRGVDALLRFYTPAGSNQTDLIVYSVTNGTVAGIGIPSPVAPVVQITETTNTVWVPGEYQPGSDDGGKPIFALFAYFVTIPAAGEPWLNLSLSSEGLTLAWPTNPVAGALQQNSDLRTTNWLTVSNTPVLSNNWCRVTVPTTNGQCFYRLVSP